MGDTKEKKKTKRIRKGEVLDTYKEAKESEEVKEVREVVEPKKDNTIYVVLVAFVFLCGILVGKNCRIPGLTTNRTNVVSSVNENGVDMSRFWQVWNLIKQDYVDSDTIKDEDLIEGAISGMVDELGDSATVFLDAEQTKAFNDSSAGSSFEGIGAELGYKNGSVIVVSPLEGHPAKAAGVRAGDYILKIDDYELTSEDSVYDAVAKIRGKAGTDVVLTVRHEGETDPVEIKITRQAVKVSSMTLEYVGDNKDIALLSISRFTDATLMEWEKLWDKEVSEIKASGVKKLIIDLRGNPGGFFNAAVYAADDLLDSGIITQQKDGKGNIKKFTAKSGGDLTDIKVVVLVNSASASASEILTGALQQNGRATVVGTKTFGKGTAQDVYNISGDASLHLTVLKWLLPDGRNLDNDNPIVPDEVVEYTNEDFIAGKDTQLNRAIEILNK
ncbi:S41 family peptidase [bacterium]|nr:S41 family peptidase [bacterium]